MTEEILSKAKISKFQVKASHTKMCLFSNEKFRITGSKHETIKWAEFREQAKEEAPKNKQPAWT